MFFVTILQGMLREKTKIYLHISEKSSIFARKLKTNRKLYYIRYEKSTFSNYGGRDERWSVCRR